jgi:hypothetical protein
VIVPTVTHAALREVLETMFSAQSQRCLRDATMSLSVSLFAESSVRHQGEKVVGPGQSSSLGPAWELLDTARSDSPAPCAEDKEKEETTEKGRLLGCYVVRLL